MWGLTVSVPDHCLSFYFGNNVAHHGKSDAVWCQTVMIYLSRMWYCSKLSI